MGSLQQHRSICFRPSGYYPVRLHSAQKYFTDNLLTAIGPNTLYNCESYLRQSIEVQWGTSGQLRKIKISALTLSAEHFL